MTFSLTSYPSIGVTFSLTIDIRQIWKKRRPKMASLNIHPAAGKKGEIFIK
jgi:hypothetical protein